MLGRLRELGERTSIDDYGSGYGSGYGSLGYLHRLPAKKLELDPSLTVGVLTDPRAVAAVRHTAAPAHDLDLRLVTGGVEDVTVARVLAGPGCDLAQGHGIARPMPVEVFRTWLRRHAAGFDLPVDRVPATP